MKTIQKDSMMPAMPTTQVSRRKRMTPKMFCRHGRYTPMKVPIRGACQRGQHQSLHALLSTNSLAHTSSMFLPCLSSLASPPSSLFPLALASFSPFYLPPGSSCCLPHASFKTSPSSSPPPSSFISHSFPYPHSPRPPSFLCHSLLHPHHMSYLSLSPPQHIHTRYICCSVEFPDS